MRRRTTIEDVALAAGVGKVTVSYVLNGRATATRISEATAERVRSAAAELNYRPNANARSLKRQRADAIAVVFQYADTFSASSAFVSELMGGVCAACVEEGFDVVLHTKRYDDPHAEVAALADGRTDGALILRDADDPLLPLLRRAHLPVVHFFNRPVGEDASFVDCDNRRGGEIAAEHLLRLGHRKLGMIAGPAGSTAAQERREGFAASAMGANIFYGGESVAQWVEREAITGLFAWSDDAALDALDDLRSHGLRVPEEISVIGFDSTWTCERATPRLTSIRQPVRQMAGDAVRLLARAISSPDSTFSSLIVPPTLDVRASCGPFVAEAKS